MGKGTASASSTVNGDDVGMIQGSDGARLALESFTAVRIHRQPSQQHLEGHAASEARVLGGVDFAHAALTQGFDDAVVADAGSDQCDAPVNRAVRWQAIIRRIRRAALNRGARVLRHTGSAMPHIARQPCHQDSGCSSPVCPESSQRIASVSPEFGERGGLLRSPEHEEQA